MFIAFSVSTLALAVGQVASSGTLTSRGNRQESSKHSPQESTSVEIHDLVETVFGIAMGTVAVWGITRAVLHQSKIFRSRSWPVVPGTVQKGEILSRGATKILYVPFRSLLGYSYKGNSLPYWGLFAFIAEDRKTVEKLQLQAEGKPVTVRYNPKSPEESLLEDRGLLGRRVIQDPFYLDHS